VPLGSMPGMSYEEKKIVLGAGEGTLFYSDGLVEAYHVHREMFGFPRLRALPLRERKSTPSEERWEQEDDVPF
jgi:serine phosphatase RsbU (regulator of sigma subunit)